MVASRNTLDLSRVLMKQVAWSTVQGDSPAVESTGPNGAGGARAASSMPAWSVPIAACPAKPPAPPGLATSGDLWKEF
ncbi:hypothetical protein [Dyella sp. EPa41]|uniref:hypothetical protein n=1 Tax=Dyella sp. EPa41 TaxID=1561194 RepID=UPI001916C48E|nr:hypothetical protein [Dyella sp. EPa41]